MERFSSKVKRRRNGCWEWTGATAGPIHRYGRFLFNGKLEYAHRVAFMLANPAWDGKLLVCHRCNNRICVRPDHLFAGSHADNNRGVHEGLLRPKCSLQVRLHGVSAFGQSSPDLDWTDVNGRLTAPVLLCASRCDRPSA